MVNAAAELELRLIARDEMSKVFKQAKDEASGFSKTIGDVGKVAAGFLSANVLAGAGEKLVGFANDSINAFKESKQASAQLEAVLKSTGGAAGMTADELKDLASALEQQSLFEDEAIIGAESLLLTFTNIGKDVMPDAISTVLDMSQALGQDLKSSSVQLGKALNDPINGITALSRVGVSFTEEQKEQIKAMQEAGDVAGAQKLILAELTKEFGGSAKAASDAAGGAEKTRDAMNNLKEEIGEKLLPVQEAWQKAQLAAITFILDTAIPALEKFIAKHPEIREAAESVVSFITEHWPEISKVIDFMADNFATRVEGMIQTAEGIIGFVRHVVEGVDALIHGDWQRAWDSFKQIPSDIANMLEGELKNALGNLPYELFQEGKKAGEALYDGVKEGIKSIPGAILGALNPFKGGSLSSAVNEAKQQLQAQSNPLQAPWFGQSLFGNASGTDFWRGGRTLVGEKGPEIVDLPTGSRIYSNADSMKMGGGVVVNFNGSTVIQAQDMETAQRGAQRYGWAVASAARARGAA